MSRLERKWRENSGDCRTGREGTKKKKKGRRTERVRGGHVQGRQEDSGGMDQNA